MGGAIWLKARGRTHLYCLLRLSKWVEFSALKRDFEHIKKKKKEIRLHGLSGRGYLAKSENTRYVVYSACLIGRRYVGKSERSDTLCYIPDLSKWAEQCL